MKFAAAATLILMTRGFAFTNADELTLRTKEVSVSVPATGTAFSATDTLQTDHDPLADANECLSGLRWTPGEFTVRCEAPVPGRGDLLIRFPSPTPTGDPVNDNVSMELYVAKDSNKRPLRARSVIVVHESGRGMTVGRIFARGLSARGLHTFLIHMPGYGARNTPSSNRPEHMLTAMKQAVTDVRRARDAAVCLPFVDATFVGLQGTSLGGFVCSTTAGLDDGYDRTFILLAGGNLHLVVENGAKDAARVRERLASVGITGDKIRELARPVEPLRLAHRIKADRTWLYSGQYDDVVPPECSKALVEKAGLTNDHHIEMPADHYSGIIFLPAVINQICERMTSDLSHQQIVEESE